MKRLLPALLVPVLLAGCGSPQSAPTPPPTTASELSTEPPALSPALPLPENAVGNALSRLDGIAADVMAKSGIPGMAVAVVHGGKTVYAKGFGVKDATGTDKVGPDTVFQLASLSKSLSATVVAHQVSEKKISWDSPVTADLPWFELADPAATRMLTVGDLLAHRSGLPDHSGDLLELIGYGRRQVLDRLGQLPLTPFRSSYSYTNFGFTAGAEAVAVAAGRPWEDLADETLFTPLGMKSTSFRLADFAAQPDRAVGHVHSGGKFQPVGLHNADAQAPAGGASASVNDMARWLALLLADGTYDGKKVIDPAALLPALTPQAVSAPPAVPAMRSFFYGYGFGVATTEAGRTILSHSGAFSTAATNFVALPAADVAIIAVTNAGPVGAPEALTAIFADLVEFGNPRHDWYDLYAKVFEQKEKPAGALAGQQPPADAKPAAPLPSYAGSYANTHWGPARVRVKNGQLWLAVGPSFEAQLRHWDGDLFVFGLGEAYPNDVCQAAFDGDRLTLEFFNTDGLGVFKR